MCSWDEQSDRAASRLNQGGRDMKSERFGGPALLQSMLGATAPLRGCPGVFCPDTS